MPGATLDETVVTFDGTASPWLLTDERGSVIGLSGGSGSATVNRYDEYGVPASGNAGRFQYTGQMWLPDAGLYHYRARAYAPQIGRFMQVDPAGYAQGANLYAYVAGDPMNFTDPSGLGWQIICVTIQDEHGNDITDTATGLPAESCSRRYRVGNPRVVGSGIFGGGPDISSYFGGYEASDRGPVFNDPQFPGFEVARQEALRKNAVYAEPVLWLIPAAPAIRGYRALNAIRRACNCFVAGTEVMTEDGLKPIEAVRMGDRVLARDENTGETGYRLVTALIDGAERQIWDVAVETPDAAGPLVRETIGTTNEHPWRLVGGGWVETDDLIPGMEIVTVDGDRAIIISAIPTERREQTYNFEVEGFHTYFVGKNGLWVHNACDRFFRGALRRSIMSEGARCAYCSQTATQVDHIVPHSRGGPTSAGNGIPACASCNASKGSKNVIDWLLSQGFR